MRDEAIYNLARINLCNGIFKSEILSFGLPRKFFKFSRNDNNNIGSMRDGLPQPLTRLRNDASCVISFMRHYGLLRFHKWNLTMTQELAFRHCEAVRKHNEAIHNQAYFKDSIAESRIDKIIDCHENFSNFLAMTKWQTHWFLVIARNEMTKQSIILQKVNFAVS